MTLAARSAEIQAKIQAQMKKAGTQWGVLIWGNWLPDSEQRVCYTDTYPGDPLDGGRSRRPAALTSRSQRVAADPRRTAHERVIRI